MIELVPSSVVGNQVVGAAQHLTRSTGEVLQVPAPMALLDDDMAATPRLNLTSDNEISFDLGTWELRDLQRGRDVGLCVYDEPGSQSMREMATRYVREARSLRLHELGEWVQQVLAEMQGGAA